MANYGTIEAESSLLGCLPVIVEIASGKDADTPNGPGEYWSEVQKVWWRKRDGTKGKEVSEAVLDRAEKQDYGFCDLMDVAFDNHARQEWEDEHLGPAPADDPENDTGFVFFADTMS